MTTPSEQGKPGTNPGGPPEDAMGCLSAQSSRPSTERAVSVKGMGWVCSCGRPGGSPSLRKRPGGQRSGQALLRLARGEPQPAFSESTAPRPLLHRPRLQWHARVSAGVRVWGPAWGPTAALAKMQTGFSQQSQVPEVLPHFSGESGSGFPGSSARDIPSPHIQAWRRQFRQHFGSAAAAWHQSLGAV